MCNGTPFKIEKILASAAWGNGLEQQLGEGTDVCCHLLSSNRSLNDAVKEHDGMVSIGDRNITNLRFADDTDALAEEEQELEALV